MDQTFDAVAPVSHECSGQFTHDACRYEDAAWDHLLDRPARCNCGCHLASARLSRQCRDGRWHQACAHSDAAWDWVLDRPARCTCGCHGTRDATTPAPGRD